MNLTISSKSGFTLIELTLVVLIIALLVVALLSDYGKGLKVARLQVGTESLVALLNEQRTLARSGMLVNGLPGCYGLKVVVDGFPSINQTLKMVQSGFQKDVGCSTTLQEVAVPLSMPVGVGISSVDVRSQSSGVTWSPAPPASSAVILYEPLDGKVFFWFPEPPNQATIPGEDAQGVNEAVFVIDYQGDPVYSKTVLVDGLSGGVSF